MRTLALALLVPLAFAVATPASATTECSEVYTHGVLGERRVARRCMGWSGNWICTHTAQGPVEYDICTPSV